MWHWKFEPGRIKYSYGKNRFFSKQILSHFLRQASSVNTRLRRYDWTGKPYAIFSWLLWLKFVRNYAFYNHYDYNMLTNANDETMSLSCRYIFNRA